MTEGDFIKNVLQNIYKNLDISYYSMQPLCFFRVYAPV
jgi:hypothetical protein